MHVAQYSPQELCTGTDLFNPLLYAIHFVPEGNDVHSVNSPKSESTVMLDTSLSSADTDRLALLLSETANLAQQMTAYAKISYSSREWVVPLLKL